MVSNALRNPKTLQASSYSSPPPHMLKSPATKERAFTLQVDLTKSRSSKKLAPSHFSSVLVKCRHVWHGVGLEMGGEEVNYIVLNGDAGVEDAIAHASLPSRGRLECMRRTLHDWVLRQDEIPAVRQAVHGRVPGVPPLVSALPVEPFLATPSACPYFLHQDHVEL